MNENKIFDCEVEFKGENVDIFNNMNYVELDFGLGVKPMVLIYFANIDKDVNLGTTGKVAFINRLDSTLLTDSFLIGFYIDNKKYTMIMKRKVLG